MVRAPCCKKMGLKKGPWSPEEDQILVAYIKNHGHGNWRAIPKQAGLLRCGKSCRLRWTNYLRPDIKRGNFTREEEETIISLHQMLGNRWSAIAARLPGRTDNEIKNVWHTHLKKRTSSNPAAAAAAAAQESNKPKPKVASKLKQADAVSPSRSYSDLSSATASSVVTREGIESSTKEESMEESLEGFPEIEESFWSDALSSSLSDPIESFSSSSNDDEMNFWLKVFMDSGETLELPEI